MLLRWLSVTLLCSMSSSVRLRIVVQVRRRTHQILEVPELEDQEVSAKHDLGPSLDHAALAAWRVALIVRSRVRDPLLWRCGRARWPPLQPSADLRFAHLRSSRPLHCTPLRQLTLSRFSVLCRCSRR